MEKPQDKENNDDNKDNEDNESNEDKESNEDNEDDDYDENNMSSKEKLNKCPYDYLIKQQIISLSLDKLKQLEEKLQLYRDEFTKLNNITEHEMWRSELSEISKISAELLKTPEIYSEDDDNRKRSNGSSKKRKLKSLKSMKSRNL